ncbi:MAG: isoprenylcysteine carboxylmethyltransferase family protein [Candidatus Omnitrophota bacterium]
MGFIFLISLFVVIILCLALVVSVLLVNPYYGFQMHKGKRQGQRLISSGPYRFVRHPGYLSGVVLCLGLIMLSLFLSIVVRAIIFIYIFITLIEVFKMTAKEDELLHKDLEGYSQYAQRVRYRLFPWIW